MIRAIPFFARRPLRGPRNGAAPADFGELITGWHPEDAVLSGASVTSWPSRWGGSYTLSVADAPQYSATGWNAAAPAILFDGSNDAAYHDALAVGAGDDQPWYAVLACEWVARSISATVMSSGSTVGDSPRHRLAISSADATRLRANRVADNGITSSVDGAAGTATNGRRIYSWEYTGTAITVREDGVALSGMSSASQDVPTATLLDRFSLGCRRYGAGSNATFANIRLGPVLLYSALTDEAGARAYLLSLGYSP